MRRKPRALVLLAPGTNCHQETARALAKVGASPEIVTLNQLLSGKKSMLEFDLLIFPGGFSFGDHFGSGRVAALALAIRLKDQVAAAVAKQIPMLGVCNGYQILTAMGLLPGGGWQNPAAVLDFNRSGLFEHRHNVKVVLHAGSVWTTGLEGFEFTMPVGHAEGRYETDDKEVKVIATYGSSLGEADYKASPSGSPIAGTADPTGLVAGMMPHPERRADEVYGSEAGLVIFKAGVDAVAA